MGTGILKVGLVSISSLLNTHRSEGEDFHLHLLSFCLSPNAPFPVKGAVFHPNKAIKGRITFHLFFWGGKRKSQKWQVSHYKGNFFSVHSTCEYLLFLVTEVWYCCSLGFLYLFSSLRFVLDYCNFREVRCWDMWSCFYRLLFCKGQINPEIHMKDMMLLEQVPYHKGLTAAQLLILVCLSSLSKQLCTLSTLVCFH